MALNFDVLFCLSAVFIQTISCQCQSGALINAPYANTACLSTPALNIPASSGGAFAVTSSSPIAPTGVQVVSENLAIDGSVSVAGKTPFLGTVALQGSIPAGGQAGVQYSCGNGNIGITSEGGNAAAAGISASGINVASGINPGLNRGPSCRGY